MYAFSSKLWYDKRWTKSGISSIYLQVVINGDHQEFPLKLKWQTDKIDLDNGILLARQKKDPDLDDYNLLIRMEQAKHTEILRTYRLKKQAIDLNLFNRELRVFSHKESLVSYMYSQSKFRYNTKEIVKRTYLNTQATIKQMLVFHADWPFELLTVAWMKKFKRSLMTLGYEPGGVWTTIKYVKSYLKLASKETLLFVDQDVVDFPNPEPHWETTYLTIKEVNALMILLEDDRLTVNQVKILNAFLFQCFTSLRISDIYRVNAKWQITEGILNFIPKKNERSRKWISIGIMPGAEAFVKNSLGKYFDLPNEGEYNLVLKNLAGMAGIKKKLTSHVGRHTFGHLYITQVGNLKGLKDNLGHANLKTTDRYAHLDDDYKIRAVQKIQDAFPWFKNRKKGNDKGDAAV